MRCKTALVAALLAAAITAIGGIGDTAADASTTTPCGTLALSQTSYTHVIWIWMENHSYETIIGSPEAPYINSLAGQCGLATNYHNISHPSLPNYIAGTSGLGLAEITKFTSDCSPSHKCSTRRQASSLRSRAGRHMRSRCPRIATVRTWVSTAVRHNPPPYYTTLSECASKDVPYTQLAGDLGGGTLPAFSFITPNLIDDMHDGTIAQGDAWLQANVPLILNSSEYQSGNVALVITWDEGENGTSNECVTNTTDIGCHVATIVVSPSTPAGTQSAALFNHYSLLASTEQLLGVPALGEALTANSMLSAFNL